MSHEIQDLAAWGKLNIWPSHPFALAGNFFEKLTDVNFVYFM